MNHQNAAKKSIEGRGQKKPIDKNKNGATNQKNPKQEREGMEKDRWFYLHIGATCVIAVFTVVLAVVAYQQYRWVQDSERPWISSSGQAISLDDEGRVRGIIWHLTNGGKSPAQNVSVSLSLRIGDAIPRDEHNMKSPLPEKCQSVPLLEGEDGPMAIPGVTIDIPIGPPPEVINSSSDINQNIRGLYVVGCIDYKDGAGRRHRTDVCEFYYPTLHTLRACPHGNKAT